MFYLRIVGLMGVGILFVYAVVYGHDVLSELFFSTMHEESKPYVIMGWVLFLAYACVVGASLWAVRAKYGKVSGRFLLPRVLGIMGLGLVLHHTVVFGYSVFLDYYHFGIIRGPPAVSFLAGSITLGASFVVISKIYHRRHGAAL